MIVDAMSGETTELIEWFASVELRSASSVATSFTGTKVVKITSIYNTSKPL